MQFLQVSILLLILPVLGSSQSVNQEDYIREYREIAIREMTRTGIPASIKLAQAILESNSGQSELARKARNHFGIKCGGGWDGPTYYLLDDDYDDNGNHVRSCFRVYRHAEASFIAHSEFLRDPAKSARYGFLFRIPPTDYKRWAKGLRKAGYATNPRYPELLIGLIERHRLDQYDLISPDALDKLAGISRINDIRVAHARADESLEDIAARTEIPARRLVKYNEGLYTAVQPLPENTLVYLQPKRHFFRGKQKWHRVEEGQTLATISQLYGIKVDKLRHKNRIPPTHEPRVGERVKLRWRVSKKKAPQSYRPGPAPELDPILPREEMEDIPEPEEIHEEEPPTVMDDSDLPPPPPPVPSREPLAPSPEDDPGDGSDPVYHTVQPGETLWRIARAHGITVATLKERNSLSSDAIQVGQRLRIK